jgi:hypothetical protein
MIDSRVMRALSPRKGGARSPRVFTRFYDMLIRAKKLVTEGKLAEIEGEDGMVTLTSTVTAGDMMATFKIEHKLRNSSSMQAVTPMQANRTWEL